MTQNGAITLKDCFVPDRNKIAIAKALKGRNINDLIANAAASSGPATAAPVAAPTGAAPTEAKKEAVSKYFSFSSVCDVLL